jgi:hypothetical protein
MKYFYTYIIAVLFLISCGKNEIKKETLKDKNPIVLDTIKETVIDIEEIEEGPAIFFTVQIAALKNDNTTFKSIENIQTFEEDNLTKYRLGQFKTYKEARNFRASILNRYPDAFVQALKNSVPINIKEALK